MFNVKQLGNFVTILVLECGNSVYTDLSMVWGSGMHLASEYFYRVFMKI
jgi:hypothetical protein